MGITRKSLFGFPPAPNQGSQYTQREVPLSQGVKTDTPWPILPPGSSVSMSNFLPLDGVLVPRSRLSSLNTIRTLPAGIRGVYPRPTSLNVGVWLSSDTVHGLLTSNGSISRASFVSAFGLGVANIVSGSVWQYATAFDGTFNDNLVIASAWPSSSATLHCLYTSVSGGAGVPRYSYLTSAPMAACVGAYDNYILAFNIGSGGNFSTRVQWCVRGSPSNWTSEGSGFEDLLDMRGDGTRVMGTADQRVLLFSTEEVWYGVSATYPAQFQFFPLDRTVGCLAPGTVVDTEMGAIFLGTDRSLRLLPRGGGASQILSGPVAPLLRKYNMITPNRSWALYDPWRKLYHLFIDGTTGANGDDVPYAVALVFNVATGEWGFSDYNAPTPRCGAAYPTLNDTNWVGRIFLGSSTGTVYSFNSTLANENGAQPTSVWRSAPIASDLPGNYKQLTEIDIDYRATSLSTLTISISTDGGNTFESSDRTVVLSTAAVAGRATSQMYIGGAFPAIHLASTSTGFELHRMDVTMALGGRKSG